MSWLAINLPQARRRWLWLQVVLNLLVAIATGAILFRGIRPEVVSDAEYIGTLLMGLGAVIAIGIAPKRLLEEMDTNDPIRASILAISGPVAGVLSWVIMMWWYLEFLDGWQPPVRWMFASMYGFLGSVIVLGFVLSPILQLVMTRCVQWMAKRSPRRMG